jgi:hypothetical protein
VRPKIEKIEKIHFLIQKSLTLFFFFLEPMRDFQALGEATGTTRENIYFSIFGDIFAFPYPLNTMSRATVHIYM